ncbi:hypothetical protein HZS_6011 [Henneguya salminicola]|nr:hypothetical protein HZS_6011 [Henneguya salminicola]
MVQKMMEKDLLSSQHFVNLIFLVMAPSSNLIQTLSQLYKFSAKYNNALIQCVFALTERKTQTPYKKVREKVLENVEITR